MNFKVGDRVRCVADPRIINYEKYRKYENKIATINSVISDNEWFDVYFDDESLNTTPYRTAATGFFDSQLEKI